MLENICLLSYMAFYLYHFRMKWITAPHIKTAPRRTENQSSLKIQLLVDIQIFKRGILFF
mgnify:CR=1 FL=1